VLIAQFRAHGGKENARCCSSLFRPKVARTCNLGASISNFPWSFLQILANFVKSTRLQTSQQEGRQSGCRGEMAKRGASHCEIPLSEVNLFPSQSSQHESNLKGVILSGAPFRRSEGISAEPNYRVSQTAPLPSSLLGTRRFLAHPDQIDIVRTSHSIVGHRHVCRLHLCD
jgi:hypothetical protein